MLCLGDTVPLAASYSTCEWPIRPTRSHCVALGAGLVLGAPSLGRFGVVCVVECVLRTWRHGAGPCPPNPLQRQQVHLSATTGRRCRSLEVDKPSKAQGGARIPWGGLAGWCIFVVWDAFVCGVVLCVCCVARFCLGVSCGQGWLGDVFHPACPSIALRTTGGALTLA